MLLFLIYHASVLYPHVLYTKDIYFREEEEDCVCHHLSVESAGENYFNPGYIEVNNGEDLLLYYGGAAFTHAGDADDNQHWKSSSSGLGAIIVKRDRFASINGGYIFNKKTIPTLRTVTMKVPDISNGAAEKVFWWITILYSFNMLC